VVGDLALSLRATTPIPASISTSKRSRGRRT
jgi:hypothetical protein